MVILIDWYPCSQTTGAHRGQQRTGRYERTRHRASQIHMHNEVGPTVHRACSLRAGDTRAESGSQPPSPCMWGGMYVHIRYADTRVEHDGSQCHREYELSSLNRIRAGGREMRVCAFSPSTEGENGKLSTGQRGKLQGARARQSRQHSFGIRSSSGANYRSILVTCIYGFVQLSEVAGCRWRGEVATACW